MRNQTSDLRIPRYNTVDLFFDLNIDVKNVNYNHSFSVWPLRDTLTLSRASVVCSVIDSGRLADQIAKLLPIFGWNMVSNGMHACNIKSRVLNLSINYDQPNVQRSNFWFNAIFNLQGKKFEWLQGHERGIWALIPLGLHDAQALWHRSLRGMRPQGRHNSDEKCWSFQSES